ncbi:MAG: GDSL-type esterase/lipase family protein [Verrucomicrobiota bacterium]|jgi:lysophospholipase L1-like esterase
MTARQQSVMIVAFGDSITEASHQKLEYRWPEILRRQLQERFTGTNIKVINAGVGGNTSREGLARFEKDVLSHRPDFVLFEFGNDATHEPERHVTEDEFIKNQNLIIARVAKEAGGRAIPLIFPPIIDRWHVYYNHPFTKQHGGQDRYQERYREATRQMARENNCPLIDIDGALRKEMAQHGPESCILPDGVHLTAHGNECVALAVLQALAPEV